MNPEIERKNIRKQFSDRQWAALLANEEFRIAWEAGDFVRVGEIANPIVSGEAKNIREVKELKRLFDAYVNIPD